MMTYRQIRNYLENLKCSIPTVAPAAGTAERQRGSQAEAEVEAGVRCVRAHEGAGEGVCVCVGVIEAGAVVQGGSRGAVEVELWR
jgi:hypothetical protein